MPKTWKKKLAITCTLSLPPHLVITSINILGHKLSAMSVYVNKIVFILNMML